MSRLRSAVLFVLLIVSLIVLVTFMPKDKGFKGCNIVKDSNGNCVLTP